MGSCHNTMLITRVFTISCLLTILGTQLTKARHFLVETKKILKKNDAEDYTDESCGKEGCEAEIPIWDGTEECKSVLHDMDMDIAWGFDNATKACKRFTMTSCFSTCNYFVDIEKCEKMCLG